MPDGHKVIRFVREWLWDQDIATPYVLMAATGIGAEVGVVLLSVLRLL